MYLGHRSRKTDKCSRHIVSDLENRANGNSIIFFLIGHLTNVQSTRLHTAYWRDGKSCKLSSDYILANVMFQNRTSGFSAYSLAVLLVSLEIYKKRCNFEWNLSNICRCTYRSRCGRYSTMIWGIPAIKFLAEAIDVSSLWGLRGHALQVLAL